MAARVLVVDDDADIRDLLRLTLEHADFEVDSAVDGLDAIDRAHDHVPDAIVLDVMMPRLDGLATLDRIRVDGRLQHIPVLLLTARSQAEDAVAGLRAGADDYVTKPFDPDELSARVDSAIRRAARQRARNPLTGLPGNEHIGEELRRRLDSSQPFALLYVDIDDFKAYNDQYGFLRGDEVIRTTARMLVDAVHAVAPDRAFVGHVGGDDFVVLADIDDATAVAQRVSDDFDAAAPDFYDPQERAAGGLSVVDRQGMRRTFGFLTISIGIATTDVRSFAHPGEIVEVATEVKRYVKSQAHPQSQWMVDRRDSA
ncbi:MAG: response regulator [Nitriliruptoraceae bacterium]